MPKLLNIAIPTYNRVEQLEYSLKIFISQIENKLEDFIDIFISDDFSTDNTEKIIQNYASTYNFIKYRKYEKNIGLERNLIECTRCCDGKYLWIFGDDDFIEDEQALHYIVSLLKDKKYEFYILNRTRRSFDLSTLMTDNWMNVDINKNIEYPSLLQFCKEWGIISIIGFITVNIFLRKKFHDVNDKKYYGIMYPQLGMMLEAFHQQPCYFIGKPIICHRTQTPEEKRKALGNKKTEKDFMSDYKRRDAIYFGFRLINFLEHLISKKSISYKDIDNINEYVFSNIALNDFILRNLELYSRFGYEITDEDKIKAKRFFNHLNLTFLKKAKLNSIIDKSNKINKRANQKPTISVITPSFNQAEFLHDCLNSVQNQTFPAIEHLVYDPGSVDGSRDIAVQYPHVTLIAEKDCGQSDAVNKGFLGSQGDIIAWLNSDDYYFDDKVFEKIIKRFNKTDHPDIVYGKGIYVDEKSNKLRDVYINKRPDSLPWRLQQEDGILQPAVFMRKEVIEKIGLLSTKLHYCMDYEYWIRCVKAGLKIVFLNQNLACARYHIKNKTYGMRGYSFKEVCDMLLEQFGYANHNWLHRYAEYLVEGFDGVLAHGSNSEIKSPQNVSQASANLLKAYNTNADTYQLLLSNTDAKGFGDTLEEMKKHGIGQSTPCLSIPLNQKKQKGYVCYTVGPRRWAFESKWQRGQIKRAHKFLKSAIQKRTKDVCVIVGNGPSLKNIDMNILEGQDVIISNNAFLSEELVRLATYYTVVNYLVAEQGFQHINRLNGIIKIIPFWLSYCINETHNTYFVKAKGIPEFSKNIFKNISWRHTVSFYNMHIAYGLGYRKVILIGFDHNYQMNTQIPEGEIICSDEEDINHFHPDYFKGKKWQAAGVDNMESVYQLAKMAFEADGRKIVNCTVGGKLELFPRRNIYEELRKSNVIPIMKNRDQFNIAKNQMLNKNNHSGALESVSSNSPPKETATKLNSKDPYSSEAPEQDPDMIGTYERDFHAHFDETEFVYQLLSDRTSNSTMIDVGALQGGSLYPFAKKGWHVYAFEPDPVNREHLRKRMAHFPLVHIDDRAVSNCVSHSAPFYASDESPGISCLSPFRDTHEEICQVSTITLSAFCREKDITSVDFLKIDTEGYDLMVLEGFPWESFRPDYILCEFEDFKTLPLGYDIHKMARFLIDKGYNLLVSEWHPVIRYGISHDWYRLVTYPCDLSASDAWGNLIAFRQAPDMLKIAQTASSVLKLRKKMRLRKKNLGPNDSKNRSTDQNKTTVSSASRYYRINIAETSKTSFVKRLYKSFFNFLEHRYPTINRLGLFIIWSIQLLKKQMLGLGGIILLGIAGFFVAAYIFKDYRLLLFSAGVGIVLMLLGGLGVAYIRYLYKNLKINQKNEFKRQVHQAINDSQTNLKNQFEKDLQIQIDQWNHKIQELTGTLKRNQSQFETKAALLQQDLNQAVEQSGRQIAKELQAGISLLGEKVDSLNKAGNVNEGIYQPFGRYLQEEHIQRLLNFWIPKLNIENIEREALGYIAHRVCQIENNCSGRMATTIQDAVLRTLVTISIKSKNLEILEIGTLFGISLATIYDYCRGRFDQIHLTAIDPLEGYYEESTYDIITRAPISRTEFEHNMRIAHIPEKSVTLIQDPSTDQKALKIAAKRSYNLLVIDGNHSYDGVKFDFDNYHQLIEPGGYIIFDDYNSKDWPEVTEFVDNEVKSRTDFIFVGNDWRSIVFQFIK
jgi:FkbM family methyltransferase